MVSADRSGSALDARLVSRAHRAVEPLHSHVYFAPELDETLGGLGLEPGRMVYFAGRAAPMGAVGPGVVTATFCNFSPALVARHIPLAWSIAAPEQIVASRWDVARTALTRLLGGAEAVAAPEVAELAGLLREACTVLTPEARPLYAAHADLPWPDDPLLQLWHGASLLREYRGDGHVAALLDADLTGLEALITHTATGRGFTAQAARELRGWTEQEWAAARAALVDRGLLRDHPGDTGEGGNPGGGDLALTDEGVELRETIEAETDLLSADPFLHLGQERTERVVELARGMARRIVGAGAYPPGLLAARG
ncbi:hypothetical protein OF117_15475 [Geodermatophilus sp. YIM 151500]|uniref:SCO6745 family protein n=1 Tax=Geodermatophilus sp. YIM 151500 TaxID=2984531 RepID=UPI0021E3EB32|nr:hypothetical protein [Geodermatophilus sp. YIM 151500]MCV2490760.1 hypothetical protein [Geodermatophilus sp. YIM 151500]